MNEKKLHLVSSTEVRGAVYSMADYNGNLLIGLQGKVTWKVISMVFLLFHIAFFRLFFLNGNMKEMNGDWCLICLILLKFFPSIFNAALKMIFS